MLTFSLEREISRVAVQEIHQNSEKMAAFSGDFLSENDFEAVLATFCYHDYDANASEAIEKITTDQNEYHKCSLCVIVCCVVKACQGWLLGHLRLS